MMTRAKLAIGGVLIGIAMLTATAGPLAAQDPDAAAAGTPMADQGAMMEGTPSETGDTEMAGKMEQMMDQCLAMMEMMSMMMGMMGGDMSGMMGGEDMQGMEGMEDMPAMAATPDA